VKTCSDVGGLRGCNNPSVLSSVSSKTVSSEDDVTDDDSESAGVEVGVVPWVRARASACETADRYEAAEGIGDGEIFDFFLNMLGVGEGGLRAIGEGIIVSWSLTRIRR
jgi:hypothetical protein